MENNYEYPWKQDAEGDYLVLRTTEGVFELRPYDTIIFEPEDIALRALRHVYHILDEDEETGKFNGFYMWKAQFDKTGHDFDVFVEELKEHDYHVETFDEPLADDLKAYRLAHGEEFKPATLEELADRAEPSKLFEKVVEAALKDFDHKAKWYLGEWEEDYGSNS